MLAFFQLQRHFRIPLDSDWTPANHRAKVDSRLRYISQFFFSSRLKQPHYVRSYCIPGHVLSQLFNLMASAIRIRAVRLYRIAMRSAARCPHPQHAADARSIVRLKFADGRGNRAGAEQSIRGGEEEVAQLEYFHAIRESKADSTGRPVPSLAETLARVRHDVEQGHHSSTIDSRAVIHSPLINNIASTAVISSAISEARPAPSSGQLAKFCPECGTSFRKDAKFCAECGARRS